MSYQQELHLAALRDASSAEDRSPDVLDEVDLEETDLDEAFAML